MATDFRSNTTSPISPNSTAYDRVVFDNLLRRELKVGDPSNAAEIADALLRRYQGDPRATALVKEAQGLPFQQTAIAAPALPAQPTATDNDWQQAINDVERDLRELNTSALLKDVTAELGGWTDAIRSALREGENAARYGLDPHQRDKAFSIRRQLCDYARVSRLVGTLHPSARDYFRQFACSLDEASSVILVRLGESLGDAGYAGGQFLLQAPYSELQTRRDAAIYSLRNLIGATQQAYGPNDWPRGLDAYRQLYTELENQGQGDLRSLLVENELARIMDELIQRTANGRPDGLRAVGATAQVDLARFRRLVIAAHRLILPESPPLAAFLQAISLFADGFNTAGGYRLLRVARPPILLYGLYGTQGLTHADRRLLELVSRRSALAEAIDCVTECDCQTAALHAQAALDSALHMLDRAIDLYALGRHDFDLPEQRASACAYYLMAVVRVLQHPATPDWPDASLIDALEDLVPFLAPFNLVSTGDRATAKPPHWETDFTVFTRPEYIDRRTQEIRVHWRVDEQRFDTVRPFSSSGVDLFGITRLLRALAAEAIRLNNAKAPSASDAGGAEVPEPTQSILAELERVETVDIPPHFETSLDGLVHDVLRSGIGRGNDDH